MKKRNRNFSPIVEMLEDRCVPTTSVSSKILLTEGSTFSANGSVQIVDDALRLTTQQYQTATVWFEPQFAPDNITTNFDFDFSSPGGLGWGDGVTLAVIDASVHDHQSLGNGGGELGYGGLSGFAIEFDTYRNSEFGDPSNLHVGLNLGGSVVSAVTNPLPFDIRDAGVVTATVNYNQGTVIVSLQKPGLAPVQVLNADVPDAFRPALGRVGFTAATGTAFQTTQIDNFKLTVDGEVLISQSFDITDKTMSHQVDALEISLPENGTYSVDSAGNAAWFVDRDLNLSYAGSYYYNWGQQQEIWLEGKLNEFGNRWYFLKPNGELWAWNDAHFADSTLLANLDPVFYRYPALLYDARTEHMAYVIDQYLELDTTGKLHKNWGGAEEKWLLGSHSIWYYILPTGHLYQWNGAPTGAYGDLVYTFDAHYYTHIDQLHNAQFEQIVVDINAGSLTIDPAPGFVGQTVIELSNTTAGSTAAERFSVSVVNYTPDLTDLADPTMKAGQGTLEIELPPVDADEEIVTYSAFVGNIGDYLRNRYQLRFGGDWYENWGGQQEIWFPGAKTSWYFLKPNGEFYHWDGNPTQATGTLLHTLDTRYYQQPQLLTDDQSEFQPAVTVDIAGNTLRLTPPTDYTGSFPVILVASDGANESTQELMATVFSMGLVGNSTTVKEGEWLTAQIESGIRSSEFKAHVLYDGVIVHSTESVQTDEFGNAEIPLQVPYRLLKAGEQEDNIEVWLEHGGHKEEITLTLHEGLRMNVLENSVEEGQPFQIQVRQAKDYALINVRIHYADRLSHEFDPLQTDATGSLDANLTMPFLLADDVVSDTIQIELQEGSRSEFYDVKLINDVRMEFNVITNPGFREGDSFTITVEGGIPRSPVHVSIIGDGDKVEHAFGSLATDATGMLTSQLRMPYVLEKGFQVDGRLIAITHGEVTEKFHVTVLEGVRISISPDQSVPEGGNVQLEIRNGVGKSEIIVQIIGDENKVIYTYGFMETDGSGYAQRDLTVPLGLLRPGATVDGFRFRVIHAGIAKEMSLTVTEGLRIWTSFSNVREGHRFLIGVRNAVGNTAVHMDLLHDDDTQVHIFDIKETNGDGFAEIWHEMPRVIKTAAPSDAFVIRIRTQSAFTRQEEIWRFKITVHKGHTEPGDPAKPINDGSRVDLNDAIPDNSFIGLAFQKVRGASNASLQTQVRAEVANDAGFLPTIDHTVKRAPLTRGILGWLIPEAHAGGEDISQVLITPNPNPNLFERIKSWIRGLYPSSEILVPVYRLNFPVGHPLRGAGLTPYWDFGVRGKAEGHLGKDFNVNRNTKVNVVQDGIVRFAGDGGTNWGGVVIVEHYDPRFGHFYSFYGHVTPHASITIDQTVFQGQQIAVVSAGVAGDVDHLHFEIRVGPPGLGNHVGFGYAHQRLDGKSSHTMIINGDNLTWYDPVEFIRRSVSYEYI